MPDVRDDQFSSEEEDETQKLTFPLRTGLNTKELFESQTVMIEIDDDQIQKDCVSQGPNIYHYDDSTLDILDGDCLGNEDNTCDNEGEELSPFLRIEKQMVNVTEDGGVMKKLVSKGDGNPLPDGATVIIEYDAYIEYLDEPFDSSRLRKKPLRMRLGGGDVLLGFDIAVQTMTQNEVSSFLIKPEYAYGKMGCPPRIPENATIYYKVHLVDFLDYISATEFEKLTDEEKREAGFEACLKAANCEHSCGNKQCKTHKDYRRAVFHYKKGIKIMQHCTNKNEEEEALWKDKLLKLNRNISFCYLQLKDYPKTISFASDALQFHSNDVKSLYYKGKAKYLLNDFDEAKRYLTRAKHIRPFDSDIIKALTDLQLRQDKVKATDKLFCQRMFQLPTQPQVLTTMRSEMEKNVSRFMETAETKITSFTLRGDESDIAWLNEKVKSLNLKMKINDGEKKRVLLMK